MSNFAPGEEVWTERLGGLRNVVRQELVRRQLARHVRPGMSVLDIGCGQGTQAVALAAAGCEVTGIDPSKALLEVLQKAAAEAEVVVQTRVGTAEALNEVIVKRTFDVVCAHGLLMYFDDRQELLRLMSPRLAPGGTLSFTFRNGQGLAFRPGMRHDWQGALDAFDATTYANELGVPARADLLHEIETNLETLGLQVSVWYGVRIFTDAADPEEGLPPASEFAALLSAEEEAGRRDPYRQLASQIHVIATQS